MGIWTYTAVCVRSLLSINHVSLGCQLTQPIPNTSGLGRPKERRQRGHRNVISACLRSLGRPSGLDVTSVTCTYLYGDELRNIALNDEINDDICQASS